MLEAAANIGPGAGFGARHLAGPATGRGKHWREFVEKVNGLVLDARQEQDVIAGAVAGFDFFRGLLIADRKCVA